MLGEFVTRGLIMVLGYAYPAFECFKTVERNKVEIYELRFWCQYWIIVAILTVLERFGDAFVSWLPMYNETKLALFIYLWYPQAKGTRYVYHTFLRPFVVRHEPDIDRNFQELRARAWALAIYYWNNWTDLGQTAILQVLDYLTGQRGKIKNKIELRSSLFISLPDSSVASRCSLRITIIVLSAGMVIWQRLTELLMYINNPRIFGQ